MKPVASFPSLPPAESDWDRSCGVCRRVYSSLQEKAMPLSLSLSLLRFRSDPFHHLFSCFYSPVFLVFFKYWKRTNMTRHLLCVKYMISFFTKHSILQIRKLAQRSLKKKFLNLFSWTWKGLAYYLHYSVVLSYYVLSCPQVCSNLWEIFTLWRVDACVVCPQSALWKLWLSLLCLGTFSRSVSQPCYLTRPSIRSWEWALCHAATSDRGEGPF